MLLKVLRIIYGRMFNPKQDIRLRKHCRRGGRKSINSPFQWSMCKVGTRAALPSITAELWLLMDSEKEVVIGIVLAFF